MQVWQLDLASNFILTALGQPIRRSGKMLMYIHDQQMVECNMMKQKKLFSPYLQQSVMGDHGGKFARTKIFFFYLIIVAFSLHFFILARKLSF